MDFYPTLVDLCGLPPRRDLEGRSLRPLLDDPATPWNHAAFTDQRPEQSAVKPGGEHGAFPLHRIRRREESRPSCTTSKPTREWTNLADKPEHAETLAKLKKLAAEHRAKLWKEP